VLVQWHINTFFDAPGLFTTPDRYTVDASFLPRFKTTQAPRLSPSLLFGVVCSKRPQSFTSVLSEGCFHQRDFLPRFFATVPKKIVPAGLAASLFLDSSVEEKVRTTFMLSLFSLPRLFLHLLGFLMISIIFRNCLQRFDPSPPLAVHAWRLVFLCPL